MIEAKAWAAFHELSRNAEVGTRNGRVPDSVTPAKTCGCDDPVSSAPPYNRCLELMRLGPSDNYYDEEDFQLPNDTAIISFDGLIVKHCDDFEAMIFGLCDLDDIDAALAQVAADANIRNVLLNFVNCPGGTIIGVPETAGRVASLASAKNVFAFSDSVMCSAAIYIASQASQLFVTESTYSGSIGVILPPIIDMSVMMERAGIKATIIKVGKFKDTGTQLRPVTDEEKKMLLAQGELIFGMFTAAVKSGRPGMASEAMQGQVFFGREALEAGLADAVLPDLAAALAQF
jgi:capsid assembly protease